MKICWDNLEGLYLTRNGNFKKGGRIYKYKEKCKNCNRPFLSTSNDGLFCDNTCRNIGKNNPMYGKYDNKNHFFGKKHSKETRKKIGNREYKKGKNHVSWKGGYNSKGIPLYDTYAHQIEWCEEVRRNEEDSNILEVKCTYCGKWHIPKIIHINNRLYSLNGNQGGECRLYCSSSCKWECPTYRQRKYPKGFKINTSREVQPELRQMVLKRDNYKCVKCNSTESLHCHHIEGIRWEPIESADIDKCITVCKHCHNKIHQIPGCKYHEMKCEDDI